MGGCPSQVYRACKTGKLLFKSFERHGCSYNVVTEEVREDAESVRVVAASVKVVVALVSEVAESVRVDVVSVNVEAEYVNEIPPTVYVPVNEPSLGNFAIKNVSCPVAVLMPFK